MLLYSENPRRLVWRCALTSAIGATIARSICAIFHEIIFYQDLLMQSAGGRSLPSKFRLETIVTSPLLFEQPWKNIGIEWTLIKKRREHTVAQPVALFWLSVKLRKSYLGRMVRRLPGRSQSVAAVEATSFGTKLRLVRAFQISTAKILGISMASAC